MTIIWRNRLSSGDANSINFPNCRIRNIKPQAALRTGFNSYPSPRCLWHAEEISTGARQLIQAGALANVSAVFGLHNAPELPNDTFATRHGAFYANVDRFSIMVTGKGAHAAKPEEGIDSIIAASHIINALQTLPSRRVSSLESLVISVTHIGLISVARLRKSKALRSKMHNAK